MAKDSFWFKHDYNARNDEKILELTSEHGAESYGIYWMIVESMAENDNGGVKASLIGGLSHGFRVAKVRLIEIIDACLLIGLFYEKDGFYYSNRMLKHKEERKFFSEMGKEGAEKKKAKYRGASGGLHRGEERRGEKIYAIDFENDFAVFADGSKQKLGVSQLCRLNLNDLVPKDIQKGLIT
jgi:hypothetical protein